MRSSIAERLESNDAHFDRADPFMAIAAIEANSGDHIGVPPFLKPDHPLGVGPIERFVEDLALDGTDRIGPQDQPRVDRRRATSAAFRQARCAA